MNPTIVASPRGFYKRAPITKVFGVKLNTRNKLEEARFFLNKVQETMTDSKINHFYLSAFLASWRSVLDVLLYDFAEYYGMIDYYGKQPARKNVPFKKMTSRESFRVAAADLRDSAALEFIDWWDEKMEEVRVLWNHRLWKKRTEAIHEGLKPYPIIVLPFATSTEFSFAGYARYKRYVEDMSDFIEKCQEGLALMERIVSDAELEFGVSL